MSARQWDELVAYYILEPFGAVRDDLLAGMSMALFANANRKKGARVFSATDFMPSFEKPQQSPNQMKRICQGIAAAYAAKG